MRAVVKVLFLSCVLVALTGCAGMTGHWAVQSVNPDTANGQLGFDALCLLKDGTYHTCTGSGPACKMSQGTYTYDQSAKTLLLKPAEGKELKYNAELVGLGGEMKLTAGDKGHEWNATLKHGECICCPGGKPCDPKTCDPQKCAAQCHPKKGEPAKPEAKPAEQKPAAKPRTSK